MATTINFPTSLDTAFSIGMATAMNDATQDAISVVNSMSGQIIALETSVGITGSAVSDTLRYITSGVASGDKAVSLTGVETLTNKTLTSPILTSPTSTGTDNGTETLLNKNLSDSSNIIPFSGNEGFGTNYQIQTSINTNQLVVALKTQSGANATASTPINFRIFNTVRTITAALSVVIPAGTNYLNAGRVELATLEQDLFVYGGYASTSGSFGLLISRWPNANFYSDFNSTNTNDNGVYTSLSFVSTDRVEIIGRINAINSGIASYNWSLPATSLIINRSINETRYLSYLPALTATTTSPTLGTGSSQVGYYKIRSNMISVTSSISFGSSGIAVGSGSYLWSIPFIANQTLEVGRMSFNHTGVSLGSGAVTFYSASQLQANGIASATSGASGISNSTPYTWTALDNFKLTIEYGI